MVSEEISGRRWVVRILFSFERSFSIIFRYALFKQFIHFWLQQDKIFIKPENRIIATLRPVEKLRGFRDGFHYLGDFDVD
jgi:hypothetical protein